jgi:hypothetical protein
MGLESCWIGTEFADQILSTDGPKAILASPGLRPFWQARAIL